VHLVLVLFKTQYQFLTKAFYVFVIDPSRVNVYTNGLFGELIPFCLLFIYIYMERTPADLRLLLFSASPPFFQ